MHTPVPLCNAPHLGIHSLHIIVNGCSTTSPAQRESLQEQHELPLVKFPVHEHTRAPAMQVPGLGKPTSGTRACALLLSIHIVKQGIRTHLHGRPDAGNTFGTLLFDQDR
eukprot:1160393-Pelagomonas_calceolata.AAC.3